MIDRTPTGEPVTENELPLKWKQHFGYEDAMIGDFHHGDGVRFNLVYYPTCHRRGQWRLLIETAGNCWGCFDDQDQPMRWYHHYDNAISEANSIARVFLDEREP